MQVRIVNNITKEYPDMIKVVIYKEPLYFTVSDNKQKRDKREVDEKDYIPSITSLNRTKNLVRDLVLCNSFELFCTFTFDPKKVNRFNYYSCSYKMRVWLHHQKDLSSSRGKDFYYLIIPEQHKSGAWHFHALISGYSSTLHDSGLKTSSNRPIYNITSFRSGFTTAVEIDSKEGVSNYITKYITKDFIKQFNQRRFFCSTNLIRPKRELNSSIFHNTLPLFRNKVSESSISETYHLPIFNEYPTNIRLKRKTSHY